LGSSGVDIGGLKRECKCLMKKFNSTKPKYTHMFQSTILFINFIHKRCMDFTFKVVGVMGIKKTKQQDFQTT
jgi:hypothetical protein